MLRELTEGLTFKMSSSEARLFMLVSAIPLFLVVANIANIVIEEEWHPYFFSVDGDPEAPRLAQRLNAFFTVALFTGNYVGLATLLVAGIGLPSRAVGSWSAVFSVAAWLGAFACWMYSSMPYLFEDINGNNFGQDLRLEYAINAATTFAFIAAGYAFLAFRGMSDLAQAEAFDVGPADESPPPAPDAY